MKQMEKDDIGLENMRIREKWTEMNAIKCSIRKQQNGMKWLLHFPASLAQLYLRSFSLWRLKSYSTCFGSLGCPQTTVPYLKLPHCISWGKIYIDAIHHVIHSSNQSSFRLALLRYPFSAAFVYCRFVCNPVFVSAMLLSLLLCFPLMHVPLYLWSSEWVILKAKEWFPEDGRAGRNM
jgi:hypothetical protein